MRRFNITVDGKAYQVDVEEVAADASASVAAPAPKPAAPTVAAPAPVQVPVAAPVQAPAPASVQASAPAVGDGVKLESPLPGMIVGLKVPNGTPVKKGQIVLVVEAMKMENDVASPADGVITFAVSQGQNVASKQLLATVK
jgi:glutaconyl-CoA decarboxylase